MSTASNRKKNNSNRKRNSNSASKSGLDSFSKSFPDISKMGTKLQKNFMSVANNKYFLYTMLFLGISTVLGFLSVQNFNAVILFVVVAFAMRYFTKNIGVIMLIAVILSNIISVKSTIEGMTTEKTKMAKKGKKGKGKTSAKSKNVKEHDDKNSKKRVSMIEPMTEQPRNAVSGDPGSNQEEQEQEEDEQYNNSTISNGEESGHPSSSTKAKESMAPIDYKMSEDVEVDDDDDVIDMQSTQQAAYNNLNKIIGDKGFAKMTQDTEKLMSQQENLAKAMESIGPLVQNAEKMMQGLNLDKFTGMLDKLNGMMGATAGGVKGASS